MGDGNTSRSLDPPRIFPARSHAAFRPSPSRTGDGRRNAPQIRSGTKGGFNPVPFRNVQCSSRDADRIVPRGANPDPRVTGAAARVLGRRARVHSWSVGRCSLSSVALVLDSRIFGEPEELASKLLNAPFRLSEASPFWTSGRCAETS
ncbi:hypothetical protein MLD38_031373 [Melastoma candidum]|uniref:Uncharacterized protein n=1 Tax=Melastoma candidum TaxID=119954 RepID=A0ACB9MUA7_9MYRT|nr:hypothetical protein MLD38_031373 [Melastoma candidum]